MKKVMKPWKLVSMADQHPTRSIKKELLTRANQLLSVTLWPVLDLLTPYVPMVPTSEPGTPSPTLSMLISSTATLLNGQLAAFSLARWIDPSDKNCTSTLPKKTSFHFSFKLLCPIILTCVRSLTTDLIQSSPGTMSDPSLSIGPWISSSASNSGSMIGTLNKEEKIPPHLFGRHDSITSHPNNIYTQATQPASSRPPANRTPRTCFCCGLASHVITQCTAPAPATRSGQNYDSRSGQSMTAPSGFTAHYPVITPPNYTSSFKNSPAPPARNNNLQPADIYHLNYGRTGTRPSACEANVQDPTNNSDLPPAEPMDHKNEPPSNPNFSNLEFDEPAVDPQHQRDTILDTGATHHLTGDRSVLTEYTVFNPPIPLQVSTNGAPKFVMGKALHIAGFTVSYNCKDESFNILQGLRLWTKPKLNVASRKWSFISPLCFLPSHVNNPNVSTVPTFAPITATVPTSQPAIPTALTDPFLYTVPESSKPLAPSLGMTNNDKVLLQLHQQLGHTHDCQQHGSWAPCLSSPGEIHCPACLTAKSINKNTLTLDKHRFDPMNIWNVDLIGPFEIPSVGRGQYCLTLRDLGSGYSEVKILA
ncbi:hypothetical protein PSTT_00690, partial [Puccinia striiformis]